jgi:hypothetical protein
MPLPLRITTQEYARISKLVQKGTMTIRSKALRHLPPLKTMKYASG